MRPVRIWLDTALKYFAFAMAPPVLDGLGQDPRRLALEAVGSTVACVLAIAVGLSEGVPHPQHDHVVMHSIYVASAFAAVLKGASFAWCFFPAMTGLYPVLGVSMMDCGCLSQRQQTTQMAQGVQKGREAFNQQTAARSMH